jgi:hypothetical protein
MEDHESDAPDDCCHDCDLDDIEEAIFEYSPDVGMGAQNAYSKVDAPRENDLVDFTKPSRNDGGKPFGECPYRRRL